MERQRAQFQCLATTPAACEHCMVISGERRKPFGLMFVLLQLCARVVGAETNSRPHLFSTEVSLNVILDSQGSAANSHAHKLGDTNAPPSTSLPSEGERKKLERRRKLPTPPDGMPMQKVFQHSFYYTASTTDDYARSRPVLTRSSRPVSRPGGFLISLPRNFLNTFNLYDPVPVDPGPAPSELSIEEKPKARSASEPYESQILIFSGGE